MSEPVKKNQLAVDQMHSTQRDTTNAEIIKLMSRESLKKKVLEDERMFESISLPRPRTANAL
jgi:hypothetical protein